MVRGRWALALAVTMGVVSVAAGQDGQAERIEVLGDGTIWRFHITYSEPLVGTAETANPPPRPPLRPWQEGSVRWVRWGEHLTAPVPPGDWQAPSFDDSGWPRRPGPILGGYGYQRRAGAALVCVRGRFGVTDPAAAGDLRLSLTYRGGVIVYLNGEEVARQHVRPGPVQPFDLAEDYARDVFLRPDGRSVLRSVRDEPRDHKARYDARFRSLEVDLPKRHLRRGANVLAVEVHRTAIPEGLPGGWERVDWHTAGLVEAKLTAPPGTGVQPNVASPTKAHVWTADPLLPVGTGIDYGDPFEPLRPLMLHAPRNGFAMGQVVVTSPEPAGALGVGVSDLRTADGTTLPASIVEVRYVHVSDGFVPLHAGPPKEATYLPMWITVSVPPHAEPGLYRGYVTVRGLPEEARVPVELRVYDWRLGDPHEWRTSINLLQSPESVAGHYGVPRWSDRHFRLMEGSMRLMGRAGNDVLGIQAVGQTVFGDDPMIVFRREGDTWVPDLTIARRYLKQYDRLAGRPKFLVLHVWSYGMYQRGRGRDGGDVEKRAETIPVVERRGDELVPVEMPIYGKPGTEAVWRQVMEGLREIVVGLGWGEPCLLLGTSGDGWPSPETVAMFKEVAPYARWRAITHGSGVPNWGPTEADRTQPNGMVVGYCEFVRRITNRRTGAPGVPVACNSRDCCGRDPFHYRSLPGPTVITANYDGFCWKGIDYWTYTTAEGTERSALNTYVHFGNIVGSTPRTLALPGPDGAVPTTQYEMLRAGVQDVEAMLRVRAALRDETLQSRLGSSLTQRARTAMDELLALLETGHRFSPQGGGDVSYYVARLYEVTEDVTRALGLDDAPPAAE